MIFLKFNSIHKIILLVHLCTYCIIVHAQNSVNENKFPLLDSNALVDAGQTIILYQTKQFTVFTSGKIFYPEFQKLMENQQGNDYIMTVWDSLKKDTLVKTVNLEEITYSTRKVKSFLMHELMLGKALVYNKYSKKLEKYIMCKEWSFIKPYNGYARSYRIGKTEIYKIEDPWY